MDIALTVNKVTCVWVTWIILIGAAPFACGGDDCYHSGEELVTDDLPQISRFKEEFVPRHQVPGAAVAIIKDAHLVFARGFGLADREQNLPVTPQSLFRIASVSETFTAGAIMHLVQSGCLRLNDTVMPLLGPTLRSAVGVPGDERLKTFTVRHPLQRGGVGTEPNALFSASLEQPGRPLPGNRCSSAVNPRMTSCDKC